MSHVVTHYPHKALDMVEEVSYLLKNQKGVNADDFLKTSVCKDYAKASDEETKKITSDYIASTKGYFKQVEVKKDDEGNVIEGEAPAAIGNIPDLLSDSKVW